MTTKSILYLPSKQCQCSHYCPLGQNRTNLLSYSTLIVFPKSGTLLIVPLLSMLELMTLACELTILRPKLHLIWNDNQRLLHICSGTGADEEGSKATGNAGARVACGVISLQQK